MATSKTVLTKACTGHKTRQNQWNYFYDAANETGDKRLGRANKSERLNHLGAIESPYLGRANKSERLNHLGAIESPYALGVVGSGEIKKINGVLVDVQDDCHPGKKDSCRPGFCCVKEVIAYRPQYKGQKAAYKLACKRMRREGEFCMPEDVLHICPCNKGFECHAEKGMDYGHCRRVKKSINKSTKMGIGI